MFKSILNMTKTTIKRGIPWIPGETDLEIYFVLYSLATLCTVTVTNLSTSAVFH